MKAEGSYLQRILARTATEVAARKKQKPLPLLRAFAKAAPRPAPFEQTLRRAPPVRIIGELRRKNPQGFIDRDLDLSLTATEFTQGGAVALSVVTEGPYFAGTIEDLGRARQGSKLPLLRRDFIIDEYQVVESRVNGASAIVLMASKQLPELMRVTREMELDAVVEVRHAAELDQALDAGAAIVGINNRGLETLEIDLLITERLAAPAAKAGALVVSIGGISSQEDIKRLAAAGSDAFLIGEALLRSADRAAKTRELVGART